MKYKRRGFMHSYWKKSSPNKVEVSVEDKKSSASERAKLLEKIKQKIKRRSEKVEEAPQEEVGKKKESEEWSLEKLRKILGYDVEVDKSTADRERSKDKRELTAAEIQEKRRKSLEEKDKLTGRGLLSQKIKDLEKKISDTKYNKSTQLGIGIMKGQLAGLKAKLESGSKKTGGGEGAGFAVRKSGDATVILLGFPSTGKSTLLNNITNAKSAVAAYAFTTLTVIPGLLNYKQAKIQILDVPGIVEGAAKGTGRGKEVLQVIRNADLILMLIDALKPQQKKALEREVYDTHIRINQKKPDIKITKTSKDGIKVGRTVETPDLDDETIKGILNQMKISNAEVLIRDIVDSDQFIDAVEGNKLYIPAVVVVNKSDLLSAEQLENLKKFLNPDLCISAEQREHIEELKELIFQKLTLIRIYLKEIDKKPDMNEPLIMKEGDTLRGLCLKLHTDFIEKFKFARIWGKSVKFEGQKVLNLDHKLADSDIIEMHLK